MITPDKIISYWIFVWYLIYIVLYINNPKSYFVKYCNPYLAFILAILFNIIQLLYMFLKKTNSKTIVFFVIVLFFIKIIPLYTLQETHIHIKQDLFNIFIVLFVYIIYIYVVYKENIITIYKNILDSIINNNQNTPIMYILNKMFS